MTQQLRDFACEFFKAVDAQQADNLIQYISSDIRLQMANLEPTVGVESFISAFKSAEQRFDAIEHYIQGIWIGTWEKGNVISVEAIARYHFNDGLLTELPVTSTLRLDSDMKVCDYRIFMDPTPAFA